MVAFAPTEVVPLLSPEHESVWLRSGPVSLPTELLSVKSSGSLDRAVPTRYGNQLGCDDLRVTILNQLQPDVDLVSGITNEVGSNRRIRPQHRAVRLQVQTVYLVPGPPGSEEPDHEIGPDQQLTRPLQNQEWTRKIV